MHARVCFRRPLPGSPHHRYYIGRPDAHGGFTVTATQVSHPDLELVAEPPRVWMAAPPPAATRPVRKLRGTDFLLPATWKCSRCTQVKPASEFYLRGTGNRGPGSYCKACHAKVGRAARARAKGAA